MASRLNFTYRCIDDVLSIDNHYLGQMYPVELEQDKSSDIEQQPPFGDRNISNIQPQNRRGKPTGTSYNFDKVWSGAPDGRFGKYLENIEIKYMTESNTSASYLDLFLRIGKDGQLHASIYHKRDYFNFYITKYPE